MPTRGGRALEAELKEEADRWADAVASGMHETKLQNALEVVRSLHHRLEEAGAE